MGLTGFNRARREAEQAALEAAEADTNNDLDLPDTGMDAQPAEVERAATAQQAPAKPAARTGRSGKT